MKSQYINQHNQSTVETVTVISNMSSRKLLRIKVTPDLHLTCSKNRGNLGLVLKMKNTACISILLTNM